MGLNARIRRTTRDIKKLVGRGQSLTRKINLTGGDVNMQNKGYFDELSKVNITLRELIIDLNKSRNRRGRARHGS